jgi:hypothetical protein
MQMPAVPPIVLAVLMGREMLPAQGLDSIQGYCATSTSPRVSLVLVASTVLRLTALATP